MRYLSRRMVEPVPSRRQDNIKTTYSRPHRVRKLASKSSDGLSVIQSREQPGMVQRTLGGFGFIGCDTYTAIRPDYRRAFGTGTLLCPDFPHHYPRHKRNDIARTPADPILLLSTPFCCGSNPRSTLVQFEHGRLW